MAHLMSIYGWPNTVIKQEERQGHEQEQEEAVWDSKREWQALKGFKDLAKKERKKERNALNLLSFK